MTSIMAESSIRISTDKDHATGQQNATLWREWKLIQKEKQWSGTRAARWLRKPVSWFFGYDDKEVESKGDMEFTPTRRTRGHGNGDFFNDNGDFIGPEWFLPVAKFYYLNTNLNSTRGSVPEAIRCTISLPFCPPAVQRNLIKVCMNHGWSPINGEKLPSCPVELREMILARAKERKPMLPESLTRQITVAAPFVRHHRNPKDAGLDYISAAGTQMWIVNSESGEKQFIRGGDVVECDDATINFPVCVPWTMRGCPCSERYEVKVGRFQWLVAIDAGSRKILGFTYTARPRSSYRAEDVLSLMKCVSRQHGVPRIWRLEKGVWKSNLVMDAVRTMGSGRISVHSPHCKPFIEGLFNALWTKLSIWFPDASVGRFRGENKEASDILTACQTGARDPRKYFPMLGDVIAAFHAVIEQHNAHIVDSANYGRWVPNERWDEDAAARPLAQLNPETEWLFSPFVRVWKVNGNSVGGKVPLFPGCSVPHQFSHPRLLEFHGARVKCYFDPADPKCAATIALAQPWGNSRQGEIICTAMQTNETTAYVRLVMGWGDDSRENGKNALRQAATAMRREVRGIQGGSVRQTVSESEERDGSGGFTRISSGLTEPEENASRESVRDESDNARHDATADPAVFPNIPGRDPSSEGRKTPSDALDDLEKFERENAHLFI